MPIYRVKVKGRNKPVLMKADSALKAKDALVEVEALSAKEVAEAFGEPLWTIGTDLPADEKAEPAASGEGEKPATA